MDKLIEAIKALTPEDKAKFGDTLRTADASLYQGIFQSGFDTGFGKKEADLRTATERVTALTTELATATGEITKLKSNPDTTALHTQYGGQIKELTDKHTAELAKLNGQIAEGRVNDFLGALKGALSSGDTRLQGDYVEVITQRADIRSRLKVNPDGSRQVLQKGKDIPFAVSSSDEALKLLAEEIKKEAPATFILAGTDKGAGTPGAGAPGGTPGATLFDKVRESVKADESKLKLGAANAKPVGVFARLGTAGED
jgi:uncharacterized phage infection (PIP) family protein YhgE